MARQLSHRAIIAVLFLIAVITLNSDCALSQSQYEEGDWISYADFHHPNDIAIGRDVIYVATTGGVLRYHRTKNEWLDPWVIVLGRIESVDLRN
ncbi:hypothetical protein KJ564_01360, partial [bacterium]|nr:hypothetical protein [bacterium]